MAAHETFRFKTLDELRAKIAEMRLDLPLDDDVSILAKPVKIGALTAPNALIIHPMEGCDGKADGKPGRIDHPSL